MSAPKLTKKQKKGLAFRERKGKKPADALPDELEEGAVPLADVPVEDEVVAEVPKPEVKKAKNTAEVVSKKRKREVDTDADEGGKPKGAGEKVVAQESKRKGKKRKVSEAAGEGEEGTKAATASGKTRFILFVGNLKYTTSQEEIQEHFAACDPPPQIRLLTPKPKSPSSTTAKSKGCAFLEFSHRNALQQGLKLHGSTLDGRRINVELTAGGGGKSEKRVEKVKARNKSLIEERKTRVQKTAESGGEPDVNLTAPPQRHSTTSGLEEMPQKKRTWTVPEGEEVSGRGGVKKQRGKKGKPRARDWGTGANSIAVT